MTVPLRQMGESTEIFNHGWTRMDTDKTECFFVGTRRANRVRRLPSWIRTRFWQVINGTGRLWLAGRKCGKFIGYSWPVSAGFDCG